MRRFLNVDFVLAFVSVVAENFLKLGHAIDRQKHRNKLLYWSLGWLITAIALTPLLVSLILAWLGKGLRKVDKKRALLMWELYYKRSNVKVRIAWFRKYLGIPEGKRLVLLAALIGAGIGKMLHRVDLNRRHLGYFALIKIGIEVLKSREFIKRSRPLQVALTVLSVALVALQIWDGFGGFLQSSSASMPKVAAATENYTCLESIDKSNGRETTGWKVGSPTYSAIVQLGDSIYHLRPGETYTLDRGGSQYLFSCEETGMELFNNLEWSASLPGSELYSYVLRTPTSEDATTQTKPEPSTQTEGCGEVLSPDRSDPAWNGHNWYVGSVIYWTVVLPWTNLSSDMHEQREFRMILAPGETANLKMGGTQIFFACEESARARFEAEDSYWKNGKEIKRDIRTLDSLRQKGLVNY